jgi:hypothetical protein
VCVQKIKIESKEIEQCEKEREEEFGPKMMGRLNGRS